MKNLLAAACVSVLALLGTDAQASIISMGVPVDSNGNAVAGGNINGDGSIDFFIPLSGGHAGTYGAGGVGLTQSSFNGLGGAGSMDMFLSFSPTAGGNVLRFVFQDLDLIGVNDPNGFLESISVYTYDMSTLLAFVDDANDPEVVMANKVTQELRISLTAILPLGDPFIVKLGFVAGPVRGTNTVETIKASLVAVPEPSSLLLFGIGVLGLGFLGYRRRLAPIA